MTQLPQTPIPNVPPAKVKFNAEQRGKETGDYPLQDLREPGKIQCHDCGTLLPFEHFDDCTDPLCRRCRGTAAQRELAEIRSTQFDQISSAVFEAQRRGGTALPRLEMIFIEFMTNMGGEKAFSMLWADQFKLAIENRPGSHGVLQMFHSIAKVNLELSKRQQQEEVFDLSDQQLQDRREMMQMKMLADILSDPGKVQLLLAAQRVTAQGIEDVPGVAEKMEDANAGNAKQ